MKNLAGIAECDMFITIELARCGIEAVPGERTRGEVPASVTGRLGAFTFRRAWYYWVAEGPFPLDVASRLYESEPAWTKDVRAGGHCGCPHPREQAEYYDASGVQVLDRKNEAEAKRCAESGSPTMAPIGREILAKYAFADDPSAAAARSYVNGFHIDSELGLRLFADAVRALGKP